MHKQDILRDAVTMFKSSNQGTKEYMDLFGVVQSVLRQGSGLMWCDVEEVIQEALN